MRGIYRWLVNSPHKGPVTRKCFHLMTSSWLSHRWRLQWAWVWERAENGCSALWLIKSTIPHLVPVFVDGLWKHLWWRWWLYFAFVCDGSQGQLRRSLSDHVADMCRNVRAIVKQNPATDDYMPGAVNFNCMVSTFILFQQNFENSSNVKRKSFTSLLCLTGSYHENQSGAMLYQFS